MLKLIKEMWMKHSSITAFDERGIARLGMNEEEFKIAFEEIYEAGRRKGYSEGFSEAQMDWN